ncbi:MAG TPA: 2-oxoacid:acceptor oxidoreductase family protein [Anaerolineaceae bacterium]|nr:2-oxoacid:acceptor oxidoreductase family protein [Anaerolineaceae bacterium]
MNPATFARELTYIKPGGVLFYADDFKFENTRTDVTVYPMPVKKLIKEADVPSNLRDYIANMVYVGVVAQMLGIDLDLVYKALDFHFKGKQKAIDSNWNIVKAAADWAAANLVKTDPYRVAPMNATEGYMLAEGNVAAALGAIYGGVQFVGWYPITPATSLAESLNEYLPILRKDPETGKNTYAVVQAEDELAAIGMTIGAGFSGLRAMTSTSGPGLSLMVEYLGLAYYTEVPCVVWDVQRVGPSTGLPTRTAQADITFVNFSGHGDTNFPILFPGSVDECFEFGWKAFDLAERLQMPVIVLSDLDLGMNNWMTKKFVYPDKPMDRGKILWEEDLQKMLDERNGDYGRYLDIDGDAIPYRTVPGNRHPRSAYFARGTGHDEYTRYSEDPETWERVMDRLATKYKNARKYVPEPVVETMPGAKIGILTAGSAGPAVLEARDQLAAMGIATDYLRIKALPFTDNVKEFIGAHERTYVVELNRDGQLKQLLTIEAPEYATRLRKASHNDGLPLSARWIREHILSQEEK